MNIEFPPQYMVILDKVLPMSKSVDGLGLMDVGQLGPAVRYHRNFTRNADFKD